MDAAAALLLHPVARESWALHCSWGPLLQAHSSGMRSLLKVNCDFEAWDEWVEG